MINKGIVKIEFKSNEYAELEPWRILIYSNINVFWLVWLDLNQKQQEEENKIPPSTRYDRRCFISYLKCLDTIWYLIHRHLN